MIAALSAGGEYHRCAELIDRGYENVAERLNKPRPNSTEE
jgi:hypothetical protein